MSCVLVWRVSRARLRAVAAFSSNETDTRTRREWCDVNTINTTPNTAPHSGGRNGSEPLRKTEPLHKSCRTVLLGAGLECSGPLGLASRRARKATQMPRYTSLHFTSLHSLHFTSLHFTSLHTHTDANQPTQRDNGDTICWQVPYTQLNAVHTRYTNRRVESSATTVTEFNHPAFRTQRRRKTHILHGRLTCSQTVRKETPREPMKASARP